MKVQNNLVALTMTLAIVTGVASTHGAIISVTQSTSPSTVNLTTDGTQDWVHWSYVSGAVSLDRKSGGTGLGGFSYTNDNGQQAATGNTSFSWTDGTPTSVSAGTTSGLGLVSYDSHNAFTLTAPADNVERTLALYVAVHNTDTSGSVTANLSGGGTQSVALPSGGYNNKYYKVLIDYVAESTQTLSVTLANGTGSLYSYPDAQIYAASLSAVPEPAMLGVTLIGSLFALRRRRCI